MVTKPFHAAVGNESFRFALVEIGGDPGRLRPTCALCVKTVQALVEAQKLRSKRIEKRQLVRGKGKRLEADTPGCMDGLRAG